MIVNIDLVMVAFLFNYFILKEDIRIKVIVDWIIIIRHQLCVSLKNLHLQDLKQILLKIKVVEVGNFIIIVIINNLEEGKFIAITDIEQVIKGEFNLIMD